MKAKVLIGMFLIMSSLYWSCIDGVLDSEEEMNSTESNLITEEYNLKSGMLGKQIALLLKNEETVGTMTITNNATTLTVSFEGNSKYNLEEIQLWVGINPDAVPSTIKNKPIPGMFPYKSSDKNELQFNILLEEVASDFNFEEGNDICLFAHVCAINNSSGAEESAWSEGKYYPDEFQFTSSYSTYTPIGGGGCFPHLAFCGDMIDGIYYFDTSKGNGNIVADNEKIIGTAVFLDQNIRFYFDQPWMFSGNSPMVVITGFHKPGGQGIQVYSGDPLAPTPPMFYYYGPLTKYKYYTIELNVQYCTTQN
ncbi:hypothetical protein [uncultured Draconibacterium sp.]|uniref:hypothetical protein n=1 Tax=uncultured Draconibacterium sp. TaxID=1573823 RepID=UPI002AA7983D|nr:hypothetical protein [uncultured Draconibacterium sp.]